MISSPDWRLCLVTPPEFEPAAFASLVARLLAIGDVAALRLRLPGADPRQISAAVAALAPVTRQADIALLLDGDPGLARQLGCDGVHVAPTAVRAARSVFGIDGTVGAACGNLRDAAMTAADDGADYVAFGPVIGDDAVMRETVVDWAMAMLVPCVVAGGLSATSLPTWATTGAEFLTLGRALWRATEGPETMLRAVLDARRKAARGG
jgi:thiamine-phosphate pyrophosphorylase